MSAVKAQVVGLVKQRVDVLVSQTLGRCFGVENHHGTIQLDSRTMGNVKKLIAEIDTVTGFLAALDAIVQRHIEGSKDVAELIERVHSKLQTRFFDRDMFGTRIYYDDAQLVHRSLLSLALKHAKRDFEKAVSLAEKSAQSSEPTDGCGI